MPRVAFRSLAILLALLLAACGDQPLDPKPEPIGDFRLGYAIVVADAPQQGPFSREATDEELETAIATELKRRLGRYDGNGLYHIGVNVEGYVLAQPGIPVVYQPKSVVVFALSVFDNATQKRLTEEPERLYAFEGLRNTVPLLGSGMTRTAEEQLHNLAVSVAMEVEAYLKRHPEWFEPKPGQVRVPFPPEGEVVGETVGRTQAQPQRQPQERAAGQPQGQTQAQPAN